MKIHKILQKTLWVLTGLCFWLIWAKLLIWESINVIGCSRQVMTGGPEVQAPAPFQRYLLSIVLKRGKSLVKRDKRSGRSRACRWSISCCLSQPVSLRSFSNCLSVGNSWHTLKAFDFSFPSDSFKHPLVPLYKWKYFISDFWYILQESTTKGWTCVHTQCLFSTSCSSCCIIKQSASGMLCYCEQRQDGLCSVNASVYLWRWRL